MTDPYIDKILSADVYDVAKETPLTEAPSLSERLGCDVFLKREDLQPIFSFKCRGAYNKMASLSAEQRARGVVAASAGNHAQGVALAAQKLGVDATIVMPVTTPSIKVDAVRRRGANVVLQGDAFDQASEYANALVEKRGATYLHPFDDPSVIAGQGTVGVEVARQASAPADYVFIPCGGGGLLSGMAVYLKHVWPEVKIIGVEPKGAPSMLTSIKNNRNTELKSIENFVDGAAVKRVGDLNFTICKETLHDVITVDEGKICQTILDLYNKDAIVVEPAGALSLSGLEQYKKYIKGKNVVCIISGSNNDITRTAEIKERALLYANLKHYFIIKFPQRSGALREFVAEILGPTDDITHFEYTKKTNRENGAAVVGLQLKSPEDLKPLITKMKLYNFYGDYLNDKPDLFQFLV